MMLGELISVDEKLGQALFLFGDLKSEPSLAQIDLKKLDKLNPDLNPEHLRPGVRVACSLSSQKSSPGEISELCRLEIVDFPISAVKDVHVSKASIVYKEKVILKINFYSIICKLCY